MIYVLQVRLDGILTLADLVQPNEIVLELGLSFRFLLPRLPVISFLGGNLPLELSNLLLENCLLVHVFLIDGAGKLLPRQKLERLYLLR